MQHTQRCLITRLLSILIGVALLPSSAIANDDAELSHSSIKLPSLAPVVERVMPSVVNIATNSKSVASRKQPSFPFNYNTPHTERRVVNLGSGVIIDAKKGYIVTNHHVVNSADEIWVTLDDGRRLQATLLGSDNATDLAIIQVQMADLQAIPLADSDAARVGDFVLAVGNPFGLERSVTSGIISAKGRSNLGIKGFENFIQTDASINPGNSGGALVNLKGELVGINTAILSAGNGGGNIGVGFSIPSNMIKPIMQQIIQYGRVERGELGIKIRNLSSDLMEALKIPVSRGVVVASVNDDSPAKAAGIQKNDVIVRVNNRRIYSMEQLRNQISLHRPGTELTLDYYRGQQLKQAKTVIGKSLIRLWSIAKTYPALSGSYYSESDQAGNNKRDGVDVSRVDQHSRAWLAGLRPGDRVNSVNEEKIKDLQDFIRLVSKHGHHDMVFHIYRGRSSFYLVMQRM